MGIIGITKLVCDYINAKDGKPCGKMFMIMDGSPHPPGSEKFQRVIDMEGNPKAFCGWPHLLQHGVDFLKATPKVPAAPLPKTEPETVKPTKSQLKRLKDMGVITPDVENGATDDIIPPAPEALTLDEDAPL